MITDQPSIAILIDCWEDPQRWKKSKQYPVDKMKKYFIQTILNFIESNQNITTVVLASYSATQEYGEADHIWYKNNREFYGTAKLNKIRLLYHAHHQFYKDFSKEPTTTNQTILNYVNLDKFQISMHWLWELEYYLSLHPEIKNVYVFGEAWEVCVRSRPLGYFSLLEIPNINILTNTTCVLGMAMTCPYLPNNTFWKPLNNNTYLLKR